MNEGSILGSSETFMVIDSPDIEYLSLDQFNGKDCLPFVHMCLARLPLISNRVQSCEATMTPIRQRILQIPRFSQKMAPSLKARFIHKQSTLEVERKFVPAYNFHSLMDAVASRRVASPKVHPERWICEPPKSIRDTYYDLDDKLFDKGAWFRHRTTAPTTDHDAFLNCPREGVWEAKVRISGDYIDSQFVEIQGEEQLKAYLLENLPNVKLEDLKITFDLVAVRHGWTIQAGSPSNGEALTVVYDDVKDVQGVSHSLCTEANFRHIVGEVEVVKEISDKTKNSEHERKEELHRMRAKITNFMDTHKELFSPEKPVGKLSAYAAWKQNRKA